MKRNFFPLSETSFSPASVPPTSFEEMDAHARLRDIVGKHGEGNIALTSSFGVQSVIMINVMQECGFNLPIVTLDIPGDDFDTQREYREKLRAHYNLDLHTVKIEDEEGKRAAMDQALSDLGVCVEVAGIRADQTGNRARKELVEHHEKTGVTKFHPILDWSDDIAHEYVMSVDEGLRHPEYALGVQTKGGRVLDDAEEKTECTLHRPLDYQI